MEASSSQQYKEKEQRIRRPSAFDKMEGLVREMQDPETGVPVRSQKLFLTSIPSAFMGYDLIEWLMERLNIEESVEAVHIANQLCQYGYFFPVNDSRTLTVKDDSSLYRFQTPYYWPWQHRQPDNVEYAIYLAKRTLRNKQRHGLEDYELESLNNLKKNLQNKWDIIQLQAEEQVKLAKDRKKGDKIVSDSQERAFWRVCRPPPGCSNSFDVVPLPSRAWPGLPRPPPRKRTLNDLQREVELLRNSLTRTRVKFSVAVENLKTYFETYVEYDPMMTQPLPSNPWITDDLTFWQLNSPLVDVPTEKRVKRWAISIEELMSDPTGLQEFTNYLQKEYSHENIRFWLAVKDLRHSFQAKINDKVNEIFREFLAPGAPCEINIDGKTMEKVHQEMKNPTRFTFDAAAEHVYTLLLKKDCYPRFIRSDHYRGLLAAGIQPLQKKRFFNFGGQGKKKPTSTAQAGSLSQQQSTTTLMSQQQFHSIVSGGRRRGSDRSLSGSAHELVMCGVREPAASTTRVPHSHSQSNLTDIPYRDAGAPEATARPMDDVCPWDTPAEPPASSAGRTPSAEASQPSSSTVAGQPSHPASTTPATTTTTATTIAAASRSSRKNSQPDSCSSSSDVSVAVSESADRLVRKPEQPAGSSQQHPHHHHHYHHHHHHHQPQQQKCGGSAHMQRNYSLGLFGSGSTSTRVKLAETSSASVATCNFPSPQHSFDLSYGQRQQLHHQAASVAEMMAPSPVEPLPEEPLPPISAAATPPADRYSQSQQPSRSAKAPLISISAIVGELPEELPATDEDTITDTPDTSSDCALMSEPLTQTQSVAEVEEVAASSSTSQQRPATPKLEQSEIVTEAVAKSTDPARETEQTDTAEPLATTATTTTTTATTPSATTSKEQRDNNVNEVCPWEDEENCRVDAPYVKTYATLGYL